MRNKAPPILTLLPSYCTSLSFATACRYIRTLEKTSITKLPVAFVLLSARLIPAPLCRRSLPCCSFPPHLHHHHHHHLSYSSLAATAPTDLSAATALSAFFGSPRIVESNRRSHSTWTSSPPREIASALHLRIRSRAASLHLAFLALSCTTAANLSYGNLPPSISAALSKP